MAKDKGKVFNTKSELLAVLQELKTESEGKGRDEYAQGIGQLIQDLNNNKRDVSEVAVKGRVKIRKFNGDKDPQDDVAVPVEVQDFITDL